jgi:uncharacterized protein
MQGKPAKCLVVIEVDTVFFQCARAIHRSKLWQRLPDDVLNRVPSAGAMLAALTDSAIDGEQYDRELPERHRSTLY